ncbi:MAG: 5-bromo-4-chloroindolyl phosphate hydrolysis family protein [Clostridia bacterium]|nr:5-bromo-4-chloroindolyl phosphate hydrolysis family protein [Clostridia bacterium]
MDNQRKAKWAKIKWGWVALSFILGVWPLGVALIILRLMGEEAEEELKRERMRKSKNEWWEATGEVRKETTTRTQTYQDVKARPVQEKATGNNTQWQGSSYRSGGKTAQKSGAAQAKREYDPSFDSYYQKRELASVLSPKKGKGLQIAGGIVLALAAMGGTLSLVENLAYGWLADGLMEMVSFGFALGLPGLAMLIAGTNKRKRNARCRNHLAMIGKRRTVSLDALDAASPGNFKTVCKDLEWMLGQGFFPGAYLDMGRRVLTYSGEPVEEPAKAARPKATVNANGDREYPEERTIRQLDDRIEDPYVSQRIQRLAQLTHQIFDYVENNPGKEHKIRQFRNHYLPKTIKILETYARMERQNVSGTNIDAAMQDVEKIMDKLVAGFEKQLDALFDSEAMDVTTDINVLESMMNMEGLGDLDPFGSAAAQKNTQTK